MRTSGRRGASDACLHTWARGVRDSLGSDVIGDGGCQSGESHASGQRGPCGQLLQMTFFLALTQAWRSVWLCGLPSSDRQCPLLDGSRSGGLVVVGLPDPPSRSPDWASLPGLAPRSLGWGRAAAAGAQGGSLPPLPPSPPSPTRSLGRGVGGVGGRRLYPRHSSWGRRRTGVRPGWASLRSRPGLHPCFMQNML